MYERREAWLDYWWRYWSIVLNIFYWHPSCYVLQYSFVSNEWQKGTDKGAGPVTRPVPFWQIFRLLVVIFYDIMYIMVALMFQCSIVQCLSCWNKRHNSKYPNSTWLSYCFHSCFNVYTGTFHNLLVCWFGVLCHWSDVTRPFSSMMLLGYVFNSALWLVDGSGHLLHVASGIMERCKIVLS